MEKFKRELKKLAKKHKITPEELRTCVSQLKRGNMKLLRTMFVRNNAHLIRKVVNATSVFNRSSLHPRNIKLILRARKYIGYSDRYAACDVLRSLEFELERQNRLKRLRYVK